MRPVPRHLAPEGRTERLITRTVILLSLVALGVYAWWRVTSTLAGAARPLAWTLLAVEAWFWVKHALAVLPAMALPIGGRAADASVVPAVDVIAVMRDEPIRILQVTLKSCLEVRGRGGLAAVNLLHRPDVDALCARLGVTVVDPGRATDLGTEPGRAAELLVLVPGSSWVSADIGVMAAPAFDRDDVASVTTAATTHGLVWLVGTRGYLPPVFGDDRLTMRLDSVGALAATPGPVVQRKSHLRSVGGVCWDARNPVLATQVRLAAAGWRSRGINAPGSYRMAPASESRALWERSTRAADWCDALRRADAVPVVNRAPVTQRFWQRFVEVSAYVERWSVMARLAALMLVSVALLTNRIPVQLDPGELLVFGGSWLVFGVLARRRAMGRRQAGIENARVGFRSMGADLIVLLGIDRGWARRQAPLQNALMAALLGTMAYTVWQTVGGQFGGPDAFERFAMLVALLAVPALIRDATMAYRQQRQLPRVSYTGRGPGDVLELSPEGLDVAGELPIGSTHRVDLTIPLSGGRRVRRTLPGTVVAHRRFGSAVSSYLRLYSDEEIFIELAYFCAVTAPTMRWYGVEPWVVRPLAIAPEHPSGRSDPASAGHPSR